MVAEADPLALFWDTDDDVEDVNMAGGGAFAPGHSGRDDRVAADPLGGLESQVPYSLQSSVSIRDAVVSQPPHQQASAGMRAGSAPQLDWNDDDEEEEDVHDFNLGARPSPKGGNGGPAGPVGSAGPLYRPPPCHPDPNHVANFVPFPNVIGAMSSAGCPMTLYDWQADCLRRPNVLEGGANLVYCAPTSGGKSMVAELLMLRRTMETGKPALLVLPYVAICTEKASHFRRVFSYLADGNQNGDGRGSPAATVVEFYGSLTGTDVLDGVKGPAVIVATIEKANILVNKWVEEANGTPEILQQRLSAVTIDELHMVGDAQRGYLLELMLTKLRYLKTSIQIIGMSATISKVEMVAEWLRAQLYITQYRPVPLQEYFVHGDRVTLPDKTLVKVLDTEIVGSSATDLDAVTALVGESVSEGHSVIVFCSSRRACQATAEFLAQRFDVQRALEAAARNEDKENPSSAEKKKASQERRRSIADELQIHQNSPAIKGQAAFRLDAINGGDAVGAVATGGADPVAEIRLNQQMSSFSSSLEKTDLQVSIENGISWHHAGLDAEERALVEQAFLGGAVSVLCATSTLAAGVNLPARRVIIRQPYIGRDKNNLLEPSKYKQMVGRAGRAGFDTAGESFLIGGKGIPDAKLYDLMNKGVEPISSGLEPAKNDLHRAVLEVIASGCVSTPTQVREYVESTLLYQLVRGDAEQVQNVMDQAKVALDRIREEGFVRWVVDKDSGQGTWKPTNTGVAVHSSGLPPDICRDIVGDLEKAQKAFVLDSDLHLIYLCVPLNEDSPIDWNRLAFLLKRMDATSSSVSEKVGVNLGLVNNQVQGTAMKKQRVNSKGGLNERSSGIGSQERICKRFWTALILQDVINETPWKHIEAKYGSTVERGLVEGIQDRASRFSGMLATFCAKSGWHKLELLIREFQRRVLHGVKPEMMDLMEVPGVKPHIARLLFDAGLKTPEMLADSTALHVESILTRIYRDVSFDERPEMKTILTNHAKGIVSRARSTVREKRNRLLEQAERLNPDNRDNRDNARQHGYQRLQPQEYQ